ncbi:helix-turn-helix domain-containing protein [Halobacillus shinanisalinarum]|uniref:Helix-turn-helix domain-containing protein n=1 Tax=Halobacillus shinanisalinarum TaxID=2932258 RepID=A0ABY4GVN6_9BACI|nr:helix-turn-helix domain-containing protein [Halobacillus shinanisalinarum]UOQ92094.1 helix-turn-helix domain-containing protein [Halobacillus shinanisalinarum]
MSDLYALLLRAKEEDQVAISELIEKFDPKMKKLSSSLPASEREDLEQELRIQILRSIQKFDIEELMPFWSCYEEEK